MWIRATRGISLEMPRVSFFGAIFRGSVSRAEE
jgi:hypothetical protein